MDEFGDTRLRVTVVDDGDDLRPIRKSRRFAGKPPGDVGRIFATSRSEPRTDDLGCGRDVDDAGGGKPVDEFATIDSFDGPPLG